MEGITERVFVSAISVAELYAGVREGEERTALDDFVKAFDIVLVDEAIATQGGLYRGDYRKSHNVGLADAIIAASAEAKNAILVTLNSKHFPMLANVIVPYRKA